MYLDTRTKEIHQVVKTAQDSDKVKQDGNKADTIELSDFVGSTGDQSSRKLVKELIHFCQKMIQSSARICSAISTWNVCKKLSRSSVTDAVTI